MNGMGHARDMVAPALAFVGLLGLVALFAFAPGQSAIFFAVPVLLFTYTAARTANGGRPLLRRHHEPEGRWSYLLRPVGDVAAFGEQLRGSAVRYQGRGVRSVN